MKKTILTIVLVLITIISCSKDCDYVRDHELIKSLTDQIDVLETKINNTTLQTVKEIYRKQIETLKEELDVAVVGECI